MTMPAAGLDYEEDVGAPDHSKLLWGNAAYALAVRVAEAFRVYGWCAAIRGVEGGGLVTDLPCVMQRPTEVAVTERQESELHRLGFTSLCHWVGTDLACFFGAASCHQPVAYQNTEVSAAAALFSRLPYILAVSRFAHYLKVMVRDRAQAFTTREDCERFLNAWVNRYVMLDQDASQEAKALYPLADARIEVVEIPEKPGRYLAVAFLRPHFQLMDPGLAARVLAELPAPAGSL
jgi:type VI secretion system protein ImpC